MKESFVASDPWRFDKPSPGQNSDDRHCCRCEVVIPKAEAKYDTSERGYVCFACKNKRRREFFAKLFGVLGTGIGVAVYFLLRMLRGARRQEQGSPGDQ